MQQRNAVLVHGNALRLGLFGANCSSGRTYATLAERWDASWENNVSLAQLPVFSAMKEDSYWG